MQDAVKPAVDFAEGIVFDPASPALPLRLQQRLSHERLTRRIGEQVQVMIDGPAGRGQFAARTAGAAFEVDGGVVVEGENLRPGALVTVRVVGAAAYDLFARVESAAEPLVHIRKGIA